MKFVFAKGTPYLVHQWKNGKSLSMVEFYSTYFHRPSNFSSVFKTIHKTTYHSIDLVFMSGAILVFKLPKNNKNYTHVVYANSPNNKKTEKM